MGIVCSTEIVPIGERCQNENPFGQLVSVFLFKPGTQFDTASDFSSDTVWDTKIVAESIIPLHGIKEVEDTSTDDLIYQSNGGEKTKMGDGIRGFIMRFNYDLKTHQILKSYSGKKWGIMTVDRNKNIMATSPDEVVYKPFSLQYFQVGRQKMASADTPAWTEVEVQFADTQEIDTDGVYLSNPTFLPTQLNGVSRITLTQVGSISANAYVVDAAYVNQSKLNGASSGADTSSPISGAVAANFQSLDGSGAVVAITGVTESTTVPGRYTISHTTYTAGTSTFKATATLKFASEALTLS